MLLPQAVTAMLPSLLSQLVVILEDTALGYIIIAINYALTVVARLVERRLQLSDRGAPPAGPADPTLAAQAPGAALV